MTGTASISFTLGQCKKTWDLVTCSHQVKGHCKFPSGYLVLRTKAVRQSPLRAAYKQNLCVDNR
jgi:hypothetical protein